MGERIE